MLDLILTRDPYETKHLRTAFPLLEGADHKLVRAEWRPTWKRQQSAERLPKLEKWKWQPPAAREGEAATEDQFKVLYVQANSIQEGQEAKPKWRREWETDEVIEATARKAQACDKYRQTRSEKDREAFKKARAEAKKICRKASNDYWVDWANHVDTAIDVGNTAEAFRLLRSRYKRKAAQLPQGDRRLEGCRDHFEQQLAPVPETGDWDALASPPLPAPPSARRTEFAEDEPANFTVRVPEIGAWWQAEGEGEGLRHRWRTWTPGEKTAGRTQATLCAVLYILQEWKPNYRKVNVKCKDAEEVEALLGRIHSERDRNYA
ncbi:MAG: hypothetical protein Q7T55_26060, partial [Solirubrobacteraceae bacterium]|nr:hypothetical protein [Solirubrobacteraceae bacterium]